MATESMEQFVTATLQGMGFKDFKVDIDVEHNHGLIYVYDHPASFKEHLPLVLESFNHVFQLVAKKNNLPSVFFDVNNYRREREGLITELARTAARKVSATKQDISLPAMNSYERRLVHMELASNPNVATESVGEGKERYIVIKPIA